ncbi:MAG: arylesterase [Burkholderiales bacterium]
MNAARRRALAALLLLPMAGVPALAQDKSKIVLVVGDSVSAGYGLGNGEGWVALLAEKLKQAKSPYTVVNASISGDTTSGGRARLPALLAQHKPAVVIIELGGNDALRGGRLQTTRENLDAMVKDAQAAGAKVLLVGMDIPPNYGPAYVKEFNALFADVAKARKVPLVPSFFAGFGEDLGSFQGDRIHPTLAAQPKLLANVWPSLEPLLRP